MNKLAQSTRTARDFGARLATKAKLRRPQLSVVVPVYNVEKYLEECLDSILTQPFHDLEIVLVDDGSTDGSAEIARRYAREHAQIRLLRQANAGLGAARNAGVAASRGRFVAFVDSDDRLPGDAYSAMVSTLRRSGSDFVVGMLKRDHGVRTHATRRMRVNHSVERIGTTVHEMPQILADVFAVNKVFRRSFWERAGMAFPVGLHYEDQPALTHAFLVARAFDVIQQTVYLWRVRDDGSSITQRRDEIADLQDRVVTKRASLVMVRESAPEVERIFLADVLPVDMQPYFRSVPGCADDYWWTLREAVSEFWSTDTVPFEETLLPVHVRMMGWLVAQGRREQLEDLVRFVELKPGGLPVSIQGDKVVCGLPGLGDVASEIPPELFELGEHEMAWEARVISSHWQPDKLSLEGFALIRNVPTAGYDTSLSARLSGPGGASLELRAERRVQPRATKFVNRATQNFDDCGFVLDVDLVAMERDHALEWGQQQTWRFDLERRVAGVSRSGGITSWVPAAVTQSWHPFGTSRSARLRKQDGHLVLDVRQD